VAEKDGPDSANQRRCAGGGGVQSKDELERFVWDEELGLIFDARRKAPGRGVWVTPSPEHVQKAVAGGFSRGFQTRVTDLDAQMIMEDMVEGIQRRMTDSVRSAIRARAAYVGGNAVEEGMRNDKVALLIIAGDASESTARKYGSNADRKSIETIQGCLEGRKIAEWCAREFVSVLGLARPFSARVSRDLRHLRSLGAIGG